MHNLLQRGFTLIELLVVTVILAIFVSVVMPEYAAITEDSKLSALDSNLANIRLAVDHYYQQHGVYPGANKSQQGPACPAGGKKGTGNINTEKAFLDQLAYFSNDDGYTCTTADATFRFGPYIRKRKLPDNPLSGKNKLNISTAGVLGMTGNNKARGWKFDVITGHFIADDAANDDR